MWGALYAYVLGCPFAGRARCCIRLKLTTNRERDVSLRGGRADGVVRSRW